MGVSGNLKSMLPGDLLQWLSLAQKTGTLVVTSKDVEKKIFFESGRVISSASNDPREYLGQFLMSHGYLNEEELRKAMEVQQQSSILLGKILVIIGLITEKDLTRLMRLKAEEEIFDVFLWKEGTFQFLDDELPQMEMVPLRIDVTGIIMEGTRRSDEWPRIREVIPNDAVVPVVQKPIEVDEEFGEAQTQVIDSIDGKRTIAEIVLESRSSSFIVCSTLRPLVRAGFIQLLEAAVAGGAPAEPEPFPAVEAGFNESDEINSLLSAAQTALRAKDFDKTQRLLKAAQNLDSNHPKVRSAVKGAEAVIMAELRNQGIHDNEVPRVTKSLEEITTMNFTPNEGFILSRINGTWDIGSLIKISPIREADALMIFYKLWKDGIIEF
ncbi:MAG TPA: DUF4388 domain-containing protein [Thermoanaerobaculia bacterium]|nr:DUF4388 domain-containing protein [Thermoanaerobaculia bacterium]